MSLRKIGLVAALCASALVACKLGDGTTTSGGSGSGASGGGGGGSIGCVFSDDSDCDSCLQSSCSAEVAACDAKADCIHEIDCSNSCEDGDCTQQCIDTYNDAADSIATCALDTCVDSCSSALLEVAPCN